MKKKIQAAILGLFILLAIGGFQKSQFICQAAEGSGSEAHKSLDVPIKDMVTMVDLGANECIPCKMMASILEKVEKKYQGKAVIVFIDVWKNKEPARRFGIRAIPTQIFFDKKGKEVLRHVGFMSEEAIVAQLKKMGVD